MILLGIGGIRLLVVCLAWCLGRAAADRELAAVGEVVIFDLPTDPSQRRSGGEGKR
jgi:hypothetical protein